MPSSSASNQAALKFINSKCEQIKQNPSLINILNTAIEKYMNLDVSVSESQIYAQKLESFMAICSLVETLSRKSVQNKNQAIVNFLEQKTRVLVEILISSEIPNALSNQQEFQIVAESLSQIIVSLDEANSHILSDKLVQKVILQKSTNQLKFDVKLLASLYQNFTRGSLVTHILQSLNKSLQQLPTIDDKKTLDSLSAFFINLPPFDLIEIGSLQVKSTLQEKSFEDQRQQEKPKKQFKKLFQTTFLRMLSLIQTQKEVATGLYRKLDSKIMSKMNNPLILSDYFLNKFKQDPEIQIQVLSCLFILVGKYGLQFENFYPRLETLIKQKKDGQSVYQMKNSKRFFKLVESALRSSKVPFKTIEAMTKAILSQIMEEQSEFSFWALSFLFNLTKKHRKMLDFLKQIPELQLMSKHYNPRIRSLVNELKRDLNKAEYLDIQKFSKIDCRQITSKKVLELHQKLNQEEYAEFKIPGLFQDL